MPFSIRVSKMLGGGKTFQVFENLVGPTNLEGLRLEVVRLGQIYLRSKIWRPGRPYIAGS
jgi:hypothetical protein